MKEKRLLSSLEESKEKEHRSNTIFSGNLTNGLGKGVISFPSFLFRRKEALCVLSILLIKLSL
jgi:hypothetical protein